MCSTILAPATAGGDRRGQKFAVKQWALKSIPSGQLARENVRKQGVEHLVKSASRFFDGGFIIAIVVTLYLSYDGNQPSGPPHESFKSGARVFLIFRYGEWQPR